MNELAEKLKNLTHDLRVAVDLSVTLRSQSPDQKKQVTKLWEEFLANLFGYIKQKSKESKDNLLSGISWAHMKLF
jgi:hypothetical protein